VLKPVIGTVFALLSVWNYPWPKLPKMKISWLQPVIFGQMEQMLFFLAMGQCLPLWPMYIWWPSWKLQDLCIHSITETPPGKEEWKQELYIRAIIQNHMSDGPWPMLNTEPSWICGYAGSSSVAKPMSQPWTTL
jgi:hypothetical protein